MRVVNFPMGTMAELMSAVVFSGICERHPGMRFVLEEAGVGWVPFMFWRFDREYDFGGPETRVFKPDIPLTMWPSEVVRKHVFFTFEVGKKGGFRRVPEIGFENFLWASDFPGSRQSMAALEGRGSCSGRSCSGQEGARLARVPERR